MLLPTLLLYATLAFAAFGIGLLILQYDLYDREPWFMVALAVLLGAAAMWAAGRSQVWLIQAVNDGGELVSNSLLSAMAGITEELGKFAAVAIIAALSRRHFNDPLDGLIYGSFAGLGAALEESVHVLSSSGATTFLPPQEPVRLAGHLVMGGIAGFGIGILTTRSRWSLAAIPACLAAAIILHTAWDMAAFAAADHYRDHDRLAAWHTAVPIGLMLIGMLIFRRFAALGARMTRRTLQVCDIRTRQGPED